MTYANNALTDAATLTAGDIVNGGSGTDTLAITITGALIDVNADNSGDTAVLTATGIEQILIANNETDNTNGTENVKFDLSSVDSSLNLIGTSSSNNANADTVFDNVATLANLQMAGKGDLTVTYSATPVAGLTDAATLTLKGVGTSSSSRSAISANGVETLNVVSGTAANYLTVANQSFETVNVSGDKNLTVTVSDTGVTVFDAHTATGVINADLSAITTANLTSVKGGTGTTDKLTLAGAVTVNSTTNDLSAVSGFERLAISDASTVTLAANTAGITYIDFSDSDDQVLALNTGYTSATTVVLTGDATANNDTITNSANVALTVVANAADIDNTTDITGGTGTDTLSLTADDGTARLDNVVGVETITISAGTTGAEDVTINFNSTNAVIAADETLTINASALTNSGARLVISSVSESNGFLSIVGGAGNDDITGGDLADTLSGGANNDTINGGSGNDVVDGGEGDDSITAGAGNDSLLGGAGNDKFILSTNLTADDTINGGSGTDTLYVESIDATALANVTDVENLAVKNGGTATLTSNLSFTSIDLTDGSTTETVTLSTGYTNATTIALDAGDKVVNSANVTLTITADGAGLTSATTITGGTGTDTITITNDNSAVNFTNVTSVNAVTVLDSATAGDDITFTLGSYATAMSINASALNGTNERLIVSGGSATKNLSITGGAGNDSIASGAGNDSIVAGGENDTINSAAGNDYISGDAGDDTFIVDSGNLTYQDTVAGGAGNDLIQVDTTSAVTDIDFMNVTSVETVEIVTDTTGALTLSTYATAAGVNKVIGLATGSNTVSAVGTTTGITFVAATAIGGNDVLTGGTGNDTFVFSGTTGLEDSGDTINGTSGTDIIRLDNTSGAVTAVVDLDDVTNIDQIVVYDNDGGNSATSQNIDLTFSDVVLTTSQTLVVNASAITDDDDALLITNSAGTSTHGTKFSITGGAGNDALVGSYLADTIVGGSGADTITGNVGADSLTGGAGNDTFVLNTGNSTSAATDVITDFTASGDKLKIVLSASDVGATGTVSLTDSGDAASNADALSLLASSTIGQYFFNTTTNQLVVDVDGNGLIQSSDMYVTLTGATGLSDADVRGFVTGGAGANTITTGGGDDVIVGGDGADNITAGAGADYIKADTAADADVDTVIGGAGNDTFVYSDGNAADKYVEAASGGTDTILVNGDLSLAGLLVGTTIGGVAADGSLTQFEQIVLASGADAIFNSAQVTGLALSVTELGGNTSVTVNASAATSTINLSNFTFTATTYIDANGASAATNALDAGTDYIYINGGTGTNAITGSSYNDVITAGTGVDTVNISNGGSDLVVLNDDTANNQSVVTGFAIANDKIGFDESEFATIEFGATGVGTATGTALAAADYNEIAAAGTLVVDKVNIITTAAGYADYNTAFAAVNASAAGELIVGFYNSATSKFELYFDADGSDNVGEVLIAQIDIVGADVASLSQTNFAVI